MNGQLLRIMNVGAHVLFQEKSQHSPGETEETKEKYETKSVPGRDSKSEPQE